MSEGAVGRLVFDRRIPPSVEMNDMDAAVRLSPAPPAFSDSTKNGTSSLLLELADQFLPLCDGRSAMQDEAGASEHAGEECRQRRGRLLELGEDQRLFLPGGDLLGDVAQARELAAVLFGPGAVAEPLRGMIADLLEPHEEGQHDAAALDALGSLELLGEILHRLLIERRLLAAQSGRRPSPPSCRADRR